MSNAKGPADYRSAKTGRFVTQQFAEKHPATTVKEHHWPARKK